MKRNFNLLEQSFYKAFSPIKSDTEIKSLKTTAYVWIIPK